MTGSVTAIGQPYPFLVPTVVYQVLEGISRDVVQPLNLLAPVLPRSTGLAVLISQTPQDAQIALQQFTPRKPDGDLRLRSFFFH